MVFSLVGTHSLGASAGYNRRPRCQVCPRNVTLRLVNSIEALLFVADSPVAPEELAQTLKVAIFEVEEALEKLGGRLHHTSSFQLVQIAGGFQFCTKPEYAEIVAKFLKPQQHKLSRALMEVLAIVAYKQPITIAEINQIRGVDSDYGLRQLVEKRLVGEVGRRSAPGRPVLYGTSQQFLHVFNLQSLADLPDLQLSGELARTIGMDVPADQPALPATTGDDEA